MPKSITIHAPDDWHLHLRDGDVLKGLVAHTAERFKRAIVMPNLVPPITSVEMAAEYLDRILAVVPDNSDFEPLMTLYLTDNTTAQTVFNAHQSCFVKAFKLYPAGATTNSDAGVSDIKKCYPAIAEMQKLGVPLLIHGEITDADIDIFEREQVFIERVLKPLCEDFPELKIVFEHITTSFAVDFVNSTSHPIAATITAHHLLMNRNHMLVGGIRPHYYCLPVLKHQQHQQALIKAATSGSEKFFLGTDSAPHAQNKKETACGCAGMYTSHAAIELYAEAFERADKLENLEAFSSLNGAKFYGLPVNSEKLTLVRESWDVPEYYQFGTNEADNTSSHRLIPLFAGEQINWKINGN
ncbi:MAG: dihydroorotase [Gammaproteobacteria bacterium]|nr:dihydroorotase [Gammaproteobacteria bacterium]